MHIRSEAKCTVNMQVCNANFEDENAASFCGVLIFFSIKNANAKIQLLFNLRGIFFPRDCIYIFAQRFFSAQFIAILFFFKKMFFFALLL